MPTFEDVMRGRVDVSRLEERLGWLGATRKDPGADPPDIAGCRLAPLPKEPNES